jgi:hypothetical protein
MSLKTFLALMVAFAIATLYLLLLQPYLFTSPIVPFSMSTRNLEEWTAVIFWPQTWILYGMGIFMTLCWLSKAALTRFVRAKDVLSTQGLWWILAILYVIFGLGAFFALSYFNGWLDGSQSIEPILWFPPFVVVAMLFMFWLPTAIATPRSMRYIPPFAMTLRKLYGG